MASLKHNSDNKFSLQGELNFASAAALCEEIEANAMLSRAVSIDCSAVTSVDSAGLCVLLAILTKSEEQVRFAQMPESLLILLKLYNLTHLIRGA